MTLHATWISLKLLNWIELKFLRWIQIYWTKFKFNGINSQLNRNKMQIGAKGIENLFMILMIHDYGVEKT
jgi:hypothetical protein